MLFFYIFFKGININLSTQKAYNREIRVNMGVSIILRSNREFGGKLDCF